MRAQSLGNAFAESNDRPGCPPSAQDADKAAAAQEYPRECCRRTVPAGAAGEERAFSCETWKLLSCMASPL